MTTKEKIEKIDNILASFEDWMHGEDGDNCTKARKLLSEIEVNNVVLDDVSLCFCVEDTETGLYESIHLDREKAEKEIADWRKFKPSKCVKIIEREIT